MCLLASVDECPAPSIIDYRTEHGKFAQLQYLLKIPGFGNHTYRKMTRLSTKTEIANAGLHVNKILEIEGDVMSLNQGQLPAAEMSKGCSYYCPGQMGQNRNSDHTCCEREFS